MKNYNSLDVTAIQCPKCLDVIFSRTRHDFHYCSCKDVGIDGGFDYIKINFKTLLPRRFKITIKGQINNIGQMLFDDWNRRKDEFGVLKFQRELTEKDSLFIFLD